MKGLLPSEKLFTGIGLIGFSYGIRPLEALHDPPNVRIHVRQEYKFQLPVGKIRFEFQEFLFQLLANVKAVAAGVLDPGSGVRSELRQLSVVPGPVFQVGLAQLVEQGPLMMAFSKIHTNPPAPPGRTSRREGVGSNRSGKLIFFFCDVAKQS
jgi:hypothetical protein